MTPEQIKAAIGIVLAAFLFSAGWFSRSWYDDSQQLTAEREKAKKRETSSQTSAETVAKIPQLTTKVYTQTTKDKVYTECVHSDDVWTTIGEAFK